MTVRAKIINEIISRIDKIPESKLEDLLKYIDQLENLTEKKESILSFAGKWKKLDEDFFMDLTDKLHANRKSDSRKIN